MGEECLFSWRARRVEEHISAGDLEVLKVWGGVIVPEERFGDLVGIVWDQQEVVDVEGS